MVSEKVLKNADFEQGFEPTTATYEALLAVASRRRDVVAAEKIWSVLTADGDNMPAGLHSYTTMISAYTAGIRRHLAEGGSAEMFTQVLCNQDSSMENADSSMTFQ